RRRPRRDGHQRATAIPGWDRSGRGAVREPAQAADQGTDQEGRAARSEGDRRVARDRGGVRAGERGESGRQRPAGQARRRARAGRRRRPHLRREVRRDLERAATRGRGAGDRRRPGGSARPRSRRPSRMEGVERREMKKRLAALAVALSFVASLSGAADSKATTTLSIKGMTCGGCVAAVKIRLKKTEGVTAYQVSLEKAEAEVTYDPSRTARGELAEW